MRRGRAGNEEVEELRDTAIKYWISGFNVLPVDSEKRPVVRGAYGEFYTSPMGMTDVLNMMKYAGKKATGLAVLGNYFCTNRDSPDENCYPHLRLVILDIDNPDTPLMKLLPSGGLTELTGPRCPKDGDKHNITCQPTEDGKDYLCVHTLKDGTKHEFKLSKAKRGMAKFYLVSEDCLKRLGILDESGTVVEGVLKLNGGDIEVRIKGYELVPPSRHPSGVRYEWAGVGEDWDFLHPPTLDCQVLEALIREGRAEAVSEEAGIVQQVVQAQAQPQAQAQAQGGRRLGAGEIAKLVELIKPIYKPGMRDSILYALWSLMYRAGIAGESVEEFTRAIVEAAGDEEARKRFSDLKWLFDNKKAWGRAKILDAFAQAFIAAGLDKEKAAAKAEELYRQVKRVLGLVKPVKLPKDVSRIINDLVNLVREGLKGLPNEVRNDVAKSVVAYASMKLAQALARVLGANARRVVAGRLVRALGHDLGIQLSVEEVLSMAVDRKAMVKGLEGEVKDSVVALLRSIDDLAKLAKSAVKAVPTQAQPSYVFVFTYRGEKTYAAVRSGDAWFAERVKIVRGEDGSIQTIELGSLVPLGISGDLDGEVVFDPYEVARFYVLRTGGKTYRGLTPEEVAEAFASDHPDVDKDLLSAFLAGFFGHVMKKKGVKKAVITPGVYEDGFANPDGDLDLTEYPPTWLVDVDRWIGKYYGPNAVVARANVALYLAKFFTPFVRRARGRTFVDNWVYNYGEGSLGKSTLATFILEPMVTSDEAVQGKYVLRIAGQLTSLPQIRAFLDVSRLPAILDEQNLPSLVHNTSLLLGGAVGYSIIGGRAKARGKGFSEVFVAKRSPIIFTNASFTMYLREVRSLGYTDNAVVRRYIIFEWERHPLPPEAHDELPEVKPILGVVDKLMKIKEFKEELLKAKNLFDVAETVIRWIEKTYKGELTKRCEELEAKEKNNTKEKGKKDSANNAGNAEVVCLSRYLEAIEWARRVYSESLRMNVRSEEEELRDAVMEAIEEKKCLIRTRDDLWACIEMYGPQIGVELVEGKGDEEDEAIKDEVINAFRELTPEGQEDQTVNKWINSNRVWVRIWTKRLGLANPHRLRMLGAKRAIDKKSGEPYFRIPLSTFVRLFLTTKPSGVEEEEAEEGESQGADGKTEE